jgi:hypothetical protein
VHISFWWENLKIKGDNLEDRDVNGRIILKWIFEKWDGKHELDQSVSG